MSELRALPPAATSEAPDAVTAPPPLGGTAPFCLHGHAGGWLVEAGHVDLFAVALDGDEPTGMRHPLGQVPANELVLGFPRFGGLTLAAVGREETILRPITRAQLAALPVARHAALLDGWLRRVGAMVFGEAPPWPEIVGDAGQMLDMPAGGRLHAHDGTLWVAPKDGELSAEGGGTTLQLTDGILPIAAGLSVLACTAARGQLLSTADAMSAGRHPEGLDRFHAMLLTAVAARIARDEEQARQRLVARGAAERRSMQWSLRRLAAIVGAAPPQAERLVGRGPAFAALSAVAEWSGIELTRTERADGEGVTLDALAMANGIGLRRVQLRDGWWRQDNGPLIGWHRDGGRARPMGKARFADDAVKRPVALLPTGTSRYRLVDPGSGEMAPVDAARAEALESEAVMVYRPLPREVRGILALTAFACRGISGDLARIVLMGALTGIAAALTPVATGFLFQSAVPRAETGQVLTVILALGLSAIGACVFDLAKVLALVRVAGRVETAMQPALMHRMLRLPANFFRGYGTGDLTNRVLSIRSIRALMTGNTLVSMLAAIFAVSSFAVILFYSPMLAAVAAAAVMVGALISAVFVFAELRHERVRVALRGQEDSLVVQALQGIIKLRVAACESRIFAVWTALLARQKERFLLARRYAGLGAIFQEVFPLLGTLLLFLAASRLLDAGGAAPTLGLGAFLAINVAFGQMMGATMAMVRAIASSLEVVPLFERVRPIVTAAPEPREDKQAAGTLSGAIEFSHVTFRYVKGGRLTLDDVSIRIEPKSFVAVVGASGSGKSTLLRLLLGFETPESGDILYDDLSIGSLDIGSLRRQIGVVLQNGSLITGNIFENLACGLPYTLPDAWDAARLAGIEDDIKAMPMGMHTLVMEGASTLSGGQRQRLMIARALMGRPPVLFLDEATSALDNRSQAVVTESLERLRTTRIVVAHRLSTVRRADRIYVMDAGRLVESGTFEELLALGGVFARLARRQIL